MVMIENIHHAGYYLEKSKVIRKLNVTAIGTIERSTTPRRGRGVASTPGSTRSNCIGRSAPCASSTSPIERRSPRYSGRDFGGADAAGIVAQQRGRDALRYVVNRLSWVAPTQFEMNRDNRNEAFARGQPAGRDHGRAPAPRNRMSVDLEQDFASIAPYTIEEASMRLPMPSRATRWTTSGRARRSPLPVGLSRSARRRAWCVCVR